MTFEEIHEAITAGVPATSREDAENSLDILTRYGGNVKTMIALRIAEARRFRQDDKTFWEDVRTRWVFEGDKTAFHYYAAGALLIALRDFKGESDLEKENRTLENQAHKCYATCIGIEESKLECLAVLRNRRGVVEVMNFIKLHYDKEWTVRQLRDALGRLYGLGRKNAKTDNPGQLTFNFFDQLEDDMVADLMEKDSFDTYSALTMAWNGALLCRNANRYLAQHAEEIGDDEITPFEQLAADLDQSRRHVETLLAAKKRAVLMLK